MAVVKTITQGGQVHIHQLRMLKQILIAGSLVALISAAACFVWKAQGLPKHDWRMASATWWARFMLVSNPSENHPRLTQMYKPPFRGRPYERSCLTILSDPLLKKTTQRMETALKHIAILSLKFGGLMFLGVMVLWFLMGEIRI